MIRNINVYMLYFWNHRMAQASLDLRCLQLSALISAELGVAFTSLWMGVPVDAEILSILSVPVEAVWVDLSTRSEKLLFCFGESDLFSWGAVNVWKAYEFSASRRILIVVIRWAGRCQTAGLRGRWFSAAEVIKRLIFGNGSHFYVLWSQMRRQGR